MNKKLVSTLIGLSIVTTGGMDAATLKESKVSITETVKGERVEVEQVENIVSATLPWKGEQGIKVTYDLGDPTIIEKLADKRKKNIVTEKVPIVGGEGFKIDITLDEKPTTNVFCYFLEGWEQYDFFYQPPLTEQEIADGAYRPPEIVGSYAVYHKTLKNHQIGGVNYETGKAFHIPFPYVWEIGKEAEKQRADNLTFDRGNLCVTVPQKFLDEANYPIRIDPTFGYSGVGGSSAFWQSDVIWGTQSATAISGTVTSVSFYSAKQATDKNSIAAIYSPDGTSRVESKETDVVSVNSTTPQWWTAAFASSVTLSSSGQYIVLVLSDATTLNGVANYYDTTDMNFYGVYDNLAQTYPTWPSDVSSLIGSWFRFSVYATYTAAEVEATGPFLLKDSAVEIKNGTLIINQ